jgi:hypothetical protein
VIIKVSTEQLVSTSSYTFAMVMIYPCHKISVDKTYRCMEFVTEPAGGPVL